MNTLTPYQGQAPATVGEALALSIQDNVQGVLGEVQTDLHLADRRRRLAAAQRRLQAINADFQRLVAEVKSEAEASLHKLYIRGCRRELVECYLALADSADQVEVTRLVDELIDKTIQALSPDQETPALPLGGKKSTKKS